MPSSGVQTCARSEEHTSELQSHDNLVCRLLLEKKKNHPPTDRPPPGVMRGHTRQRECADRRAVPAKGAWRRGRLGRIGRFLPVFVFFLNNRAPPEFYPFPLPAAFPF